MKTSGQPVHHPHPPPLNTFLYGHRQCLLLNATPASLLPFTHADPVTVSGATPSSTHRTIATNTFSSGFKLSTLLA